MAFVERERRHRPRGRAHVLQPAKELGHERILRLLGGRRHSAPHLVPRSEIVVWQSMPSYAPRALLFGLLATRTLVIVALILGIRLALGLRPLVLAMIDIATAVVVLNKVVFHHAATHQRLVRLFRHFIVYGTVIVFFHFRRHHAALSRRLERRQGLETLGTRRHERGETKRGPNARLVRRVRVHDYLQKYPSNQEAARRASRSRRPRLASDGRADELRRDRRGSLGSCIGGAGDGLRGVPNQS